MRDSAGSSVEYKAFVMDWHMVQAWNPDAKAFSIRHRGVQFSYFDVTLLTSLPNIGRPIVFERGEGARKVEQILMAVMEDRLERERLRLRHQTVQTDEHIYRNHVSVMIDL